MADLITEYVADVRYELRCRRRRKQAIVDEVRDHLLELRAEGERAGLGPDDAEHAAIARFGAAHVIARRFSPFAEAWIVAGWYLHAAMFVGVAVIAYGVGWLAFSASNWVIDGDPREIDAVATVLGFGVVIVALHAGLCWLFLDPEDVRTPARLLHEGGGWAFLALGLVVYAWGAVYIVREGELSMRTLRSEYLPMAAPLLVAGWALLGFRGSRHLIRRAD